MPFLDLQREILEEFVDAQSLITYAVCDREHRLIADRRHRATEVSREWRSRNHERDRANQNAWRKANRAKVNATNKRWEEKNPEAAAARGKRYRAKHPIKPKPWKIEPRPPSWGPAPLSVDVGTCTRCGETVETRQGCARPVRHRCVKRAA